MHKSQNQKNHSVYDVLWLSGKQLFKRLPFWVRTNFWFVLLSIPIITSPGAKAALYVTINAGLRDPGESRVKIEKVFKQAFFQYFKQGLVVSLINFALLVLILFSLYFWVSQDQLALNLVSVIAIYFLVLWFLVQPFLYPVMVDHQNLPVFQVFKQSFLLAVKNPLVAFTFSLTNTFLTLIGIVLLGPVILVVPVFIGMISTQCYWILTDQTIPDWVDPVAYQNQLAQNETDEV